MRNSKICECCLEFTSLLQSYDGKLVPPTKLSDILLSREEIEIIIIYMSSWTQRQCSCCFRDNKNFERFNWAIQVLIVLCVKILPYYCKDGNSKERTLPPESIEEESTEERKNTKKVKVMNQDPDVSESSISTVNKDNWDIDDKEKLIQFVTKVFMITFPTYLAFKQYIQLKPDDITQQEIQAITQYCEVNDSHEACIYLLRNVNLFCRIGGIRVLANCFNSTSYEYLTIQSASIVVNLAANLKVWLNFQTLLSDYVPFRSNVLSYMCKILDTELKTSQDRSLSEYIWNSLKDPMDIHIVVFDKDGLDLAHKYFLSTNLVMRLSGINQINNHINLYNDLLNSENLIDSEQTDQQLTTWLLENQMVEHIYGPNNHVEVIKQSLTILTYLAMEGKITNEHIDVIWAAAQLKHCAKQVYDILSALICNLGPGPANHLHTLLSTLEPKEHTENSLCLASHLIKYIWTNSISSYISLHQQQQMNAKLMGKIHKNKNIHSSSENNSVSGDESDDSEDEDEENSPPNPNQKIILHERMKKAANRGLKISQLTRLLKTSPSTSSEEEDEDDEDESHSEVESDINDSKVLLSSKCQSQSDSDADGERSEHSENERSVPNKDKRKILRRKKDGQGQVKLKEKNSTPKDSEVEIEMDEIDSSCNTSSSKLNLTNTSGNVNDDEKENDQSQKSTSSINVPSTISTSDDKSSKLLVNDSISNDDFKSTRMKTSANNNSKIAKSSGRKKSGKVVEQNTVINELSNFVKDSSFIQENLPSTNNSDTDGSYSSRISNKSDKNMADFDGEDDAEILLSQNQSIEFPLNKNQHTRFNLDLFRRSPVKRVNQKSFMNTTKQGFNFSLDNVCLPGQTLLWDLIQDENIVQLSEGLGSEALKILTNLLCFDADKRIKCKFIEGCVENFANNKSIVVSLRLLAKLLTSFQHLRIPEEIHRITIWAEEKLDLLAKFFTNFNKIHEITESTSPFAYITIVQARLQFLSVIFSNMGSPSNFRLSLKHVDALWDNLVVDPRSCDELFIWLNENVRMKELHALSNEALHHIFVMKIPSLPPEYITMNALTLFQQLLNIARFCQTKDISDINAISESMNYVWKIALCAENTDVSMNAINFLNIYYISKQLENEEEFVQRCMSHLSETSKDLPSTISSNEDHLISKIHRALILLKTHLEIFRKRYAYHLRKWALEGQGVDSHAQFIGDKGSVPLRIIIQPAGYHEKVTIEMLSTDYVGALRAEIAKWTETIQEYIISERLSTTGPSILNDGPIRMITQGTELSAECDEKTLSEVPIKDLQLVYVSIGASRPHKKKEPLEYSSSLPPPPRDKLPLTLLLKPEYFEQLFSLMQTLSTIQVHDTNGKYLQHTKAQVLSRRIWDILMLLPTNVSIKEGFNKISEANNSFKSLLDPSSPQKLMYSLYIVEAFIKPTHFLKPKTKEIISLKKDKADAKKDLMWREKFIQAGGLSHLFDIFLSGLLEPSSSLNRQDFWNEWKQDCLACLLKIMCQLGVRIDELNNISEQFCENESSKKPHHSKPKKRKSDDDKFNSVPRLNESMLLLMEIEGVMERLNSIFKACSEPRDQNYYKTGNYGRAQLLHYAMTLLIYWAFNCVGVRSHLYSQPEFPIWLKRLVLEDPEPTVRRELCTGIYRLCLGASSSTSNLARPIASTPELIAHLLKYLNNSLAIKPVQKFELQSQNYDCDGKEPYGPACRDYFWLLSRLLESLDKDFVKESIENPENCSLDLDGLTKNLSESIIKREYLETRQNLIKDDALIGLLVTNTVVMKYNTPFKTSKEGQIFLKQAFDCLFSLPTSQCRYLPKCKSAQSRSAAFDLLTEMAKNSAENYYLLQNLLMEQHQPKSHVPYPWDYWPWEDGRSSCGYVGLTNLGATCYLNSCMQTLYMMPQIRAEILKAQISPESKHVSTLKELQRMFAYLQESERKSYNPRSFCKVYQMDHQPLNTGEQKDMAEFFIDLVSKLEEMTPELKKLVKKLFSGVLTNNVVSLDCGHVSRTLEEFFTVRCGVADMRNLYESLDEVTVKDTLEGDNMYTCSNCGKKVRAEKRACFKKLPKILCFNTMRYTFNMITMMKEKVNSHFSFPQTLNMSGYVEKTLMPQQYQEDKKRQNNSTQSSTTTMRSSEELEQNEGEEKYTRNSESDDDSSLMYELIGVTVHTGTADGGHYYSFIRDRTCQKDKWYLFNDSEVKPFDQNELPNECFGGNMNTKTYDTNLNKFMDFSFEKTNSAYMLFYIQSDQIQNERCSNNKSSYTSAAGLYGENSLIPSLPGGSHQTYIPSFSLNDELEDWIWTDNTQFLRDKNIFEHTYFNFMWQICGHIPGTLLAQEEVYFLAAKLSTHFFLETYIHSKEKFEMVQWVELLTKQLQTSQTAAVWLLDHMTETEWWPIQILIKCPNQMVRQMFQRLCIHVIQQLRPKHLHLYLKLTEDAVSDHPNNINLEEYGSYSCVTRFIKQHLSLLENVAKSHLKHLTEFFTFLHDLSKMGEEECVFLINVQAISKIVNFYLGSKKDEVEHGSEEDDDDVLSMPEKNKVASLEKGITLIANLVEKSRDNTNSLRLSTNDWTSLTGKNFHFILQQIRDGINYASTRNLIFSLCRWNDQLAVQIINAIFDVIQKHPETSHPFYKVLNLLAEHVGGPGHPSISEPILARILSVAESCPYPTLEWLSLQVPRNKIVNKWCLSTMDTWVEHFLISHTHQRVRNAAAALLVSLVPNPIFRQGYRNTNNKFYGHCKEVILLSPEAQSILTEIYIRLLNLLKPAKHYVDAQIHGTCKLTAYFAVLTYFTISKIEKMMFCQYYMDLWNLFHPKLSEPGIPIHQNKQGLLIFWNHVCEDSPDNIQRIVHTQVISKNIGFNYILADHDDQEVVMYNRSMLPAYYGIIRKCCQHSRAFASHLARHQNINWAFKNIAQYQNLYPKACEELFKIMQIYVSKPPETPVEENEMLIFKRNTIQSFFQILDGRTSWNTLINVYRILVDNYDDRYFVVINEGIHLTFEAIYSLHTIHHEATSCHVSNDIVDILTILADLLKIIRMQFPNSEEAHIKYISNSKEWPDVLRHIATFINTYNSHEIRAISIQCLTDFIYILPMDCIRTLVPLIYHCHSTSHEIQGSIIGLGPYFPKRSQPPLGIKSQVRPSRPMLQMSIPLKVRDNLKGDEDFERQLTEFYTSYHQYMDIVCRVAIMRDCFSQELVTLSSMLGFEAAPLRFIFFPKLWLEIINTQNVDRKYIAMIVSSPYFRDYIEYTIKDDRVSLTNTIVYNFILTYIGKIFDILIADDGLLKVLNVIAKDLQKIVDKKPLEIGPIVLKLLGDLKTLTILYCPTIGRSHSGRFRAPAPSNSHIKSIINSLKSYIEELKEKSGPPPKSESPTEEPSKKRKIDNSNNEDEQAGPSTRQQSDENADQLTQELYFNKNLSTGNLTMDLAGLILSTIDTLLRQFGPSPSPADNREGENVPEQRETEELEEDNKENSLENVSPVSSRASLPTTPHNNTQSSTASSIATIVMDMSENLEAEDEERKTTSISNEADASGNVNDADATDEKK